MVGNVGGTLGLFIGFSFTGLIAFALQLFLKMMEYIEKMSNRIIEQQETSSGPSGYENEMQEKQLQQQERRLAMELRVDSSTLGSRKHL